MTIPSECRIASINPDHAMILPLTRTPTRMEFPERTRELRLPLATLTAAPQAFAAGTAGQPEDDSAGPSAMARLGCRGRHADG
jgi:hypothetical protein